MRCTTRSTGVTISGCAAWAARYAAVCDVRRAPHNGQTSRRLKQNASSLCCPHSHKRSLGSAPDPSSASPATFPPPPCGSHAPKGDTCHAQRPPVRITRHSLDVPSVVAVRLCRYLKPRTTGSGLSPPKSRPPRARGPCAAAVGPVPGASGSSRSPAVRGWP